jgi:hypothetical protein
MIPKKPALGFDPRVRTGFRKEIMLSWSGMRFEEKSSL